MPYEINIHTDWETVSTSVPLEKVYDVLYDFENYKEWNSFTYDVQIITKDKDTVSAGDSAELKVNLRVPFTNVKNNMILNFKFLEIVKNSRICWAYQMVPMQLQPYILKTRRCMEVKESSNKNISIRHYDINSGPLAPIIGFLPVQEGNNL